MFAADFVSVRLTGYLLIFLYHIFIYVYYAAIRIAALWNSKAKLWVQGRANWLPNLQQQLSGLRPLIWIHASSAGEFEQAKPVIESIKLHFPQYAILVSFFSPSGYKVAQKYPYADYITYLPLDTKKNATAFIQMAKPVLAIFAKYDFWYHHLKTTSERGIPLLLISSIFRKEQAFFKWYGHFYRNMLHLFTHIFVQDQASLHLLKEYGINQCSISGDTRFDRVAAITQHFVDIPYIEAFKGNSDLIVAGSTWPDDEQLLADYMNTSAAENCRLLIAPHEIAPENIKRITGLFSGSVRYSDYKKLFESPATKNVSLPRQKFDPSKVLIIDNVGMLSRLYKYASICYVGGGFTKDGVHNVLEAAVYGKPVIYGPNYQKYREAIGLIERGGAFTISNRDELNKLLQQLLKDEKLYRKTATEAGDYVHEMRGATATILRYIQENRLLTN